MHYANCNEKNVRKVLVKHFDSNHTIILSCHYECIDKIGVLRYPLALYAKTKAEWVVESV